MKYHIITNRRILVENGIEKIDTTNDGLPTDTLRFATFDSTSTDPQAYTLIPDKAPSQPGAAVNNVNQYDVQYYFNDNEPVKVGSEKFFLDLYHEMASPDGGDVLVMYHGFNCDWKCAIDNLRNLEKCFVGAGSPIKHLVIFSWPSRGSVMRYKSDVLDAITSGVAIGRCFQLLCEFFYEAFNGLTARLPKPCNNKIHLLCHSMGNRVLENMLAKLISDGNKFSSIFEEIILASPDVDNICFEDPQPFSRLNSLGRRIHVYYNRNDLALTVSRKYENPLKRLGTDGPSSLNNLPSHIYIIDCTEVACQTDPSVNNTLVQHWYYDRVPKVYNDILSVLKGTNDEAIQANRVKVSDIKYRLT
ncbi:alpha/beta hydrolase [Deminuibacter soli]|nr:alpha/beta hydrolase [Deminuibacter soli]